MDGSTTVANFVEELRRITIDQLKIFSGQDDVLVEPRLLGELPYSQQLVHILVSGDSLEINIKIHFMMDVARKYADAKLNIIDASDIQCLDFMKELSNIFAGKAKFMLEEVGLILGQSLPFSMQGYNEMFYDRTADQNIHAAWALVATRGSVDCSVSIRIIDDAILKPLGDARYSPSYGLSSGDVELF